MEAEVCPITELYVPDLYAPLSTLYEIHSIGRGAPDVRQFIHNHKALIAAGGVTGLALVLYLAFGVFGIHTAFIDDEVSEAGPVFASGAIVNQQTTDQEDVAMTDSEEVDSSTTDTDEMIETATDSDAESTEPAVRALATGSFEDSNVHAGTGDAVLLTDGTQTFLRFEDNFATDNGPDLNVYLRANDGSGDFVDLGDLKGNIGSQNYEVPAGTDLSRFTVVDVWCVRFGVSFTEAELA
jgi:hypothetical protein